MNEELIRLARQAIKARFLNWRDPPVELPADSVIDDAAHDVIAITMQYMVRNVSAEIKRDRPKD